MNLTRGIALAVALACGAASAADLTKIDRKLAKEPAYTSGKVRYCLAVFGADADKRLWIAADGRNLYVDLNGNGDLTDKNEKLRLAGEGALQEVSLDKERTLRITVEDDEFWLVYSGDGVHTQYAGPKPAAKVAEACIVHFAGPLTLRLDDEELDTAEDEPLLYARLGTPGLGEGTFASISYSKVPGDAHPAAEMELPAKDGSAKSLTVRVTLNERC